MNRLTGFAAAGLVALVAVSSNTGWFATRAGSAAGNRAGAANRVARDCGSEEAHQLVMNFMRAFNVGNGARLDALFAHDDGDGNSATPSFQWYSTGKPGPRFGRAAENRSTLIPYLAARHKKGERLGLVWMSHGGSAPGSGYFSFGFHIHRKARDLLRPGVFEGKGAAICVTGRPQIAVWSVGPRISSG
jgi:hypothetical protein